MQRHAADVLWEAPGSRVGSHALSLATHALRDVCTPAAAAATAAQATGAAGADAPPAARIPGPQVVFAAQ